MKIFTKKEIIPLLLIVSMFILAVSFFLTPCVPEKLPSHWNAQGEIDDYGSKNFVLFFFPALTLGIYLLMTFLPLIDPLRRNYQKFVLPYFFIRLVIVLFLAFLYFYTLFSALGKVPDIRFLIIPALSLLFIVIGYFLPQVKRNYFLGLRTPWTLNNDKVWEKTHKIGGKVFMLTGFLSLFSIFFADYSLLIFLIIVLLGAFFSFPYSYYIYRKMGLFKKHGS